MVRETLFTIRVNTAERQLMAAVAQRLDRNESDTVRHLLREKARELGVMPVAPKDDRPVATVAT
jgi:hypothetical protein